MKFNLLAKDQKSKARAGTIITDHGQIETPIFMPVGTVASVKGVHQRELKNDGYGTDLFDFLDNIEKTIKMNDN